MTFEIEVDGQSRRVVVDAIGDADGRGGRFRMSIDDVVWDVDGRRTELGWSIVYEDGRRGVDVAVTEQPRGDVLVQLPHVDVQATVDGRRFHADALDAGGKNAGVSAPMPGRIVRLLVKPGDEVAARQGVVIVEAMKMENELAASRAGRVVEVLVAEGQSVEAGRLLVRLE